MQTYPPHPAGLPDADLLKSCKVQRLRRGGPGGQHRNKVETAIVLSHQPTGVAAEANEKRSQAENQKVALYRLRHRLALAVRTPRQAALDSLPGPCWRSRLKGNKLTINPAHQDFPTLLADALDVLAAHSWADRAAASQLGVSRTQLIRLLSHQPAALELLNQQREGRGLSRLK